MQVVMDIQNYGNKNICLHFYRSLLDMYAKVISLKVKWINVLTCIWDDLSLKFYILIDVINAVIDHLIRFT